MSKKKKILHSFIIDSPSIIKGDISQEVSIKSEDLENKFIHLDMMKDGTWKLSWSHVLFTDIDTLPVIKFTTPEEEQ